MVYSYPVLVLFDAGTSHRLMSDSFTASHFTLICVDIPRGLVQIVG